MNSVTSPMGKPLDRVDGPLKVQGKAQYAAEFPLPGLLYGSVVNSTIASGRIAHIHSRAAQELPGVALVLTHENRPPVAGYDKPYEDDDAADGSPFRPPFNDRILYSGQPVALVVADTLELARHAASLIRVEYEQDDHATDLMANLEHMHKAPAELPEPRGDAEQAIDAAAFKVDVKYTTPVGASRLYGRVPARRQPEDLRQDPGRTELHALSGRCVRHERPDPDTFALRRRRLWFRFAPAVSIAAGRHGRTQAQALGARQPKTPADVYLRLPPAQHSAPGHWCRQRRPVARHSAPGNCPDLAL